MAVNVASMDAKQNRKTVITLFLGLVKTVQENKRAIVMVLSARRCCGPWAADVVARGGAWRTRVGLRHLLLAYTCQ